MLQLLATAAFLSYLLLVWFNTDAFAEYLNLLRFSWFFKLAEYNKLKKEGYAENYAGFLREYYSDLFLVRLATCTICCSFWLGLVGALFLSSFEAVCLPALILFLYIGFNKIL